MEKKNKVLNFASILDDNTRAQAEMIASMPFVWPHVALMPDAHLGIGATVGSVVPTDRAIIPAAVGVDIGCGMIAIRTQFTSMDLPDKLGPVHGMIREAIPAGVGEGHEDFKTHRLLHKLGSPTVTFTQKDSNTALRQMGTLGSGNHFVELSLDREDRVWVVVHSGSRGIGNMLARHHIQKAKNLMEALWIELPDKDLAYFVEGTPEFDAYWQDLVWAQGYARLNREVMASAVVRILGEVIRPVDPELTVNCHHNYTQREHHFGRNLLVSRKGAISARKDEWGVIPGSMGDLSYIVKGLGHVGSLTSSPHGAGRQLSRSAAKRTLSVDDLKSRMEGKTWNDRSADALVDEHPDAYKPIDQVMEDAKELVTPVYELTQFLNYKGT